MTLSRIYMLYNTEWEDDIEWRYMEVIMDCFRLLSQFNWMEKLMKVTKNFS